MYSAFVRVQSVAVLRDVVGLRQDRSGKNSASSRRALAFESDPCTMFSESSSAKSPRIVPGAESSGFVAPIIVRTTEIADSPLTASARTGPDEMKSTREPKNGLPLCSA